MECRRLLVIRRCSTARVRCRAVILDGGGSLNRSVRSATVRGAVEDVLSCISLSTGFHQGAPFFRKKLDRTYVPRKSLRMVAPAAIGVNGAGGCRYGWGSGCHEQEEASLGCATFVAL